MNCWCRRVVAAALVLLPAVESFGAPGVYGRDTCVPKIAEAVPGWPAAISSNGRRRGQPREDELSTFRRAGLRMQGGADYGGTGGGMFVRCMHSRCDRPGPAVDWLLLVNLRFAARIRHFQLGTHRRRERCAQCVLQHPLVQVSCAENLCPRC